MKRTQGPGRGCAFAGSLVPLKTCSAETGKLRQLKEQESLGGAGRCESAKALKSRDKKGFEAHVGGTCLLGLMPKPYTCFTLSPPAITA